MTQDLLLQNRESNFAEYIFDTELNWKLYVHQQFEFDFFALKLSKSALWAVVGARLSTEIPFEDLVFTDFAESICKLLKNPIVKWLFDGIEAFL